MTNHPDQEPLFPTSPTERALMQEQHPDLLVEIAVATKQLKLDTEARRGHIAGLRKKAEKLEELLRASRPRA
jgi:hypothetical protein